MFNKTRDVADGPLRAAQAYQSIVDAINSAEQAAKNASKAAQEAYHKVSFYIIKITKFIGSSCTF